MNKQLTDLFKELNLIENDINRCLNVLPKCGQECDCDEPIRYETIHNGEWSEIVATCLNCGGYMEVNK